MTEATSEGQVATMTLEENRDATLETFKTLAQQAERHESEPAALVPEGAASPPPAGSEYSPATGMDPLNAAIAATAGEPLPVPSDEQQRAAVEIATERAAEIESERLAAIEGHIAAGVSKAMAGIGNAEIVTVAAFKAGIEALLRHLHFDHPENYLPKG